MRSEEKKPLWTKGDHASFLEYVKRETLVAIDAMFGIDSVHILHSFQLGLDLDGKPIRLVMMATTEKGEEIIRSSFGATQVHRC